MLQKHKNEDRDLRILLTGGHAATTGMAVIEEIKSRNPKTKIYWIGSKQAISGSKATTLEYKIYPNMGVKYFEIKSGKLQTKFTRYTIPLLLQIPLGFIQALSLLLKIKPNVILSFGGAASFAVVFWGWVLGIPIIIHEQTVAAGRATLASARFARKIALGRQESEKYLKSSKTVVTGNPLTREIVSVKPRFSLGKDKNILVVGGSRGSEFINEEVAKIVPELSKKYKIVHVTGERDYDKYKHLASNNYAIFSYLDPMIMPKHYDTADLIIGRSGANTVSEIIYLKKPAILIPLPRTFLGEQVKNAKYAELQGVATVMLEDQVTSTGLIREIEEKFKSWASIMSKIRDHESPDVGAAKRVVDLLMEYS